MGGGKGDNQLQWGRSSQTFSYVKLCLLNFLWKRIPRIAIQLVICDCDLDPWKTSYVREFIASPAAYILQYSKNKLLWRDF